MIRLIAACFLIVYSLLTPALAQDSVKDLDARFEQLLSKYDPAAVKAARSYSQSFNTQQQLKDASEAMRPGILNHIRAKNPNIKEEDLKVFFDEFFKVALVDTAPIFEKWTILNMLEVLTTEEIVAADQFYSSPVGKSMMSKFPQIMARMPQMMGMIEKYMVPAGVAAAQAKLKAMGKEIKI